MKLGINYLAECFNVKEVYTAYESTNRVARNLYASLGFCETGEAAGNELEMKYIVKGIDGV